MRQAFQTGVSRGGSQPAATHGPLIGNDGGLCFGRRQNYKKLRIGVLTCSAATGVRFSLVVKAPFHKGKSEKNANIDLYSYRVVALMPRLFAEKAVSQQSRILRAISKTHPIMRNAHKAGM
jgi:hypothetical protein